MNTGRVKSMQTADSDCGLHGIIFLGLENNGTSGERMKDGKI